MTLNWPLALLSLLVLPLLVGLYVWAQRRRRAAPVRHSNVALVKAAQGSQRRRWARHLPLVAVLFALLSLGVASARPAMELRVPQDRTSIIVAVDISRSMCSIDVEPNRLAAAKAAVREFIDKQQEGTRIGIIAFAGYAELVAAPTTDKEELRTAVDGMITGRGTAIGAAILKSIDAIASVNPAVPPVGPDEVPAPPQMEQTEPLPPPGDVSPPTVPPVSDIVVLLTDGANTRGVLPMDAAKAAGSRGIRIYSIGFGTTEPTRMVCTREQLGADAFAEGGPYGRGDVARFLVVDEPTMKAVATATGGSYSPAADRAQLDQVLQNVPRELVLTREEVEIAPALAALAAVLLLAGIAIAVRQRRFP
ncbi:MAG: VWA domain-containing protein [Tetrasphaera sp.]